MLNNLHQAPPIDKHGEFMKGHPPTFSHTSEPLEADDWLRAVERQLDIAQCDDHEKVLFASGQLQGPTLLDRSPGRSLVRASCPTIFR